MQEQHPDHFALHHAKATARDQSQTHALAQHNAHLHAIANAETTAYMRDQQALVAALNNTTPWQPNLYKTPRPVHLRRTRPRHAQRESPRDQGKDKFHLNRSLNQGQQAARVIFDMTLLEAIEVVQPRTTNNSIHDLVTPRTPPRSGAPGSSRGLSTGLHMP